MNDGFSELEKATDMKRLLFLLLLCIVGIQIQAQVARKYQRGDFTFKSTKVKNAQGVITHVKVGAYAGGKLVDEFITELNGEPMETTAENVGMITETDLNNDGIPDVNIYLGYYGAHPNDVYYEALLWDQKTGRFHQAEGYRELAEPMVDDKTHLIFTSLRDGPDRRVMDYYGWEGNKIRHLRSESFAIEDGKYVDFSGLLDMPCYRYDARLNGRIPVIIAFQENGDGIVAGYIYYPKAKNPAPIMVAGYVTHGKDGDYYSLSEYQDDGLITGTIMMEQQWVDGWDLKVEGTWTNPKTQKELKLTDVKFSREMPEWFNTSLFAPEDPANIGREYSFRRWRQGYDDYMGGHISFRAAGKNKVYFECSNVINNIAEGKSSDGRPAVLNSNRFEYREVNECHYGFSATFFPRFVVLKTITEYETLDCFGAHSAFDGIYVKVKQ